MARLALAYSALALPALYLSYYLRAQTPGWVFVLYASAPLVVLLAELPIIRSAQRSTLYSGDSAWTASRQYRERTHSTASAAGTPASRAM